MFKDYLSEQGINIELKDGDGLRIGKDFRTVLRGGSPSGRHAISEVFNLRDQRCYSEATA